MNVVYDDRQSAMYADIHNFNALCSGDLGSDRLYSAWKPKLKP